MLANLLPVEFLVEKLRYRAALRLTTLPETHPLNDVVHNAVRYTQCDAPHPTPVHDLMADFDMHPWTMEKITAVRVGANWKSSMALRIGSSKAEAKKEESEDGAEWKLYTDGSGIGGKIGAAAILFHKEREVSTLRYRLGDESDHTVYEGEGIAAGSLGMKLLIDQRKIEGAVSVFVDSQPALRATVSHKSTPSHYIWDWWHEQARLMAEKHANALITLRWTPGHEGIRGNEHADEEAKRAAEEGSSPRLALPEFLRERLPRSKSATWQAFMASQKSRVKEQLTNSPRYARLRRYDPKLPSGEFLKFAARAPRRLAALLAQLRTGHCSLNKHLHRIAKSPTPTCPCCRQDDETVHHFLIACPAHQNARRELQRVGGLEARSVAQLMSKPKLLPLLFRFIARTGRFHSVFGDLPEYTPEKLTLLEKAAAFEKSLRTPAAPPHARTRT